MYHLREQERLNVKSLNILKNISLIFEFKLQLFHIKEIAQLKIYVLRRVYMKYSGALQCLITLPQNSIKYQIKNNYI